MQGVRGIIQRLGRYLDEKERAFRRSFSHDIIDPKQRRKSKWFVDWVDHGVLRKPWHNFSQVAPGVYRSNQPDHRRFAAYQQMGIRTILNLRGALDQAPFKFEEESCRQLGLELVTVQLSARSAPQRKKLLELVGALRDLDRPMLIHCKSGADRTGLAAGLYVMVCEGATVEEAMRQLSLRHLHIRRTATGILDHFFEVYAARNARSPVDIVDWISDEYDHHALTESFAAKQAGLKWWQGWV